MKQIPHGHSTRSSHLRLFIMLLYGYYSWLSRGLVTLDDGSKAPRIAFLKSGLLDQARMSHAQLRANLRFLERIGYIHSVKDTPGKIVLTMRLPLWICTMDTSVTTVLRLDLIHADASLLQQLPKTTRSHSSSMRPTSGSSTAPASKKRKREHPGSLPSLKGNDK